MGMTLAMLFSQAPCGLFLPHSDFYLRLRKGRLMALFYRLPFPYDSRPPKITGFAYADKIHVFRPFRLATLVCSPARCGCLTPSLIAPKRTGEFLFVRAKKQVSHKKGSLFLAVAAFAVCFLLTDFFCFYYLQTFGMCVAFESLYIFCFCFLRLFIGAVSLSGSIQQ